MEDVLLNCRWWKKVAVKPPIAHISVSLKLKRPTIRDIAKETGYSVMTVSFALRADPKVKAATRDKIMQKAEEMGYRPDPEIVRLMHRVRNNPNLETAEKLVVFNAEEDQRAFRRDVFTQSVIQSTNSRLQRHGFTLDEYWFGEGEFDPDRIGRQLLERKVQGILIPPLGDKFPSNFAFPWDKFTVVSVEERPTAPPVHRVHPDHYKNMQLLLEQLLVDGFRRIGFLSTRYMLGRDNYAYFGAFHAFCHYQRHDEIAYIPPLPNGDDVPALRSWYDEHRPEVIILTASWMEGVIRTGLGLAIPEEVSLVTLGSEFERMAGIDQQVNVLGHATADLLMAHVLRHERGIPAHPKTMMIRGEWKEGECYQPLR